MSLSEAISLIKHSLMIVIMISGPALLASLVIGILISLFQSLTQIHEATLAFVPKILVVFIVLILLGGWMLNMLVGFSKDILIKMSNILP